MKDSSGFTETRRRSTGQQPGRKSASRPGDKPRINRGSTADFVPAFGLHRISLVRAPEEAFGRRVFDALEGTRVPCPLGDQFCWHPVLPDPAPPSAGRPDPNRPWYVRVLDSTCLHRISFVIPKRRPGQCLRFAGGQEGGLSPGRIDSTAFRPTQPRPSSPPRRAPPRPDRPVVCPGFGFDRF